MAGAVAMAMWQLKTAVALDVWSPGSGPYCFEVAATPTAFALSAANGNLRVYRYGARGIELVHEFVQTNYVRVNDIAFDRQTPTLLWSAGADGCVRSWDTRSGRPAQCFSGPLARGRPIWCPICPRTHPCRLGPFKHTFTAPRWSICMSGVWPRNPPPPALFPDPARPRDDLLSFSINATGAFVAGSTSLAESSRDAAVKFWCDAVDARGGAHRGGRGACVAVRFLTPRCLCARAGVGCARTRTRNQGHAYDAVDGQLFGGPQR